MITLTYGLKRPETGDINFWTALEGDITQLDAHTHDGLTSALLTPASISPVSQAISSGSWVLVSNGIYSQVVTMTSPLTYDGVIISFRLTSNKDIIFLQAEKESSNTYTVYINDNSLDITAVYK